MRRSILLIVALGLAPTAASHGEVLELRGHLFSTHLPQDSYRAVFTYLPAQQEAYFSYTVIPCLGCPQANNDSTQPDSPLAGVASTAADGAIDIPVNLFFAVEQNDANSLVIHYPPPSTALSPIPVQFDLTLDKQLPNGNWSYFNAGCLTCLPSVDASHVEASISGFRVIPEPASALLALLVGMMPAWRIRGRSRI
jgi:hypothetical protein